MRWDRKLRARLAKIIWDKSLEIDREARAVSIGILPYMKERDSRIPLYFESVGFQRATVDEWSFDPTSNFPPLFKPNRKYLCFAVNNSMVVKVDRDLAAKFLVLGLP